MLQELFGRIEFSVFAGEEERHVGVSGLVEIIDFATVEGLGIDVNAHGALVEFRDVDNLVNGLHRIDVGGMSGV